MTRSTSQKLRVDGGPGHENDSRIGTKRKGISDYKEGSLAQHKRGEEKAFLSRTKLRKEIGFQVNLEKKKGQWKKKRETAKRRPPS